MSFDYQKLLEEILSSITSAPGVTPETLPSLDLYMDQVTSLMEDALSFTRRSEHDKILTKTMINNYAKNHLLPAPQKKKYSREHLLLLVFIYYFKNILSLQDIQTILAPLCSRYFHASPVNVEQIYREVTACAEPQVELIRSEVGDYIKRAGDLCKDAPEQDREYLRFFSLICQLGMDIYVRRHIMEKLIDSYAKEASQTDV